MSGNPLPSSFDGNTEFYEENRWQKFTRRIKEEPLVPFGCAVTCLALYRASQSIRKREHHNTNKFFRYRIYGQAFTLLCMYVGSMYYAEDRKKRKQFEGTLAEQKAAEKRELWIKELEARERDDIEARNRREALRAGFTDGFAPNPDLQARKDALSNLEAEARAKRAAQDEAQLGSGSAGHFTDPSNSHWNGGVAKAVLERSEAKKSIIELLRDLR